MKYCRFIYENTLKKGIIEGNSVVEISGSIFSEYIISKNVYKLSDVQLVLPVKPSKVVAVGLNYRAHAEELNMAFPDEPVLFLKCGETVIGPDEGIVYPAMSKRVDYEAELAVVIGRPARAVSRAEARRYILGYTCANDVTARDLQKKDGQWTRAKNFDTFCPLGPIISDEIEPNDVGVKSFLNGELKQDARTSDFIFDVDFLVSFISNIMTLNPGDVILTGTPAGIGPMQIGDVIEIEVEGIGRLKNRVVSPDQITTQITQ